MKKFFHRADSARFDRTPSGKDRRNRLTRGISNEGRRLLFEELEDRRLLSVTASEYASIREAYGDFGLSQRMSDVNIIEITANNLTAAALKSAISEAQTTAKDDLIVVRTTGSSHTITYADVGDQVQIDLDSSQYGTLSIVALGSESLTVDANNLTRVFRVASGTVNMGNLVITGGNTAGNYDGGGVYCGNYSTLTMTNCTVSGNSAWYGGGVYCGAHSVLMMTNCTVSGNSANGSGGGVDGSNYSALTLANCTVSGNNSAGYGGGVSSGYCGALELMNCTVSGNSAKSDGGGVHSGMEGMLTLINCSVSGNNANEGGGVYGYLRSTLTLANCTVSGNSANERVGGLCCPVGGIKGTNNIVTMNYGGNIDGWMSEESHNLIGYNPDFVVAPNFNARGELLNAETLDLRLTAYSAALNAGDNSANTTECDLDGNARVYGGTIDLGAYEYQGETQTPPVSETVVTSLLDTVDSTDGEWTLREAILYAREEVTITFDPSLRGGTITLLSELYLDANITIDGGDLDITVSGQGEHRVLNVGSGAEVTLSGLTITEGNADDGGGIYCGQYSTLTLTSCSVSGNGAENGGGIYGGECSTLALTNCSVSGNSAEDGGGIYGGEDSTLILTNCNLSGNNAVEYGGGVSSGYCGALELTNCTVSGNSALYGGGVLGYSMSSIIEVANSIITMNYGGNVDGRMSEESRNLIGYNPDFVVAPIFSADGGLLNAATLDLRLTATSAALNAGDNSFKTTEYDLDGNARIYGGAIDLGAYDYRGEAQTPPESETVVTSLLDTVDSTDGVWTLREVILYAREEVTITFDESLRGGTIALSSELCLDADITIDGGDLGIAVSGCGNHRVFRIGSGAEVTLFGLTITEGNADDGGGVYGAADSELTMTNCEVSGNHAKYGGGVYSLGTLTLTNCEVLGNSTSSVGGGLYGDSYSYLTLTNCEVSGNSASSGGGVYGDWCSHLALTNCSVSGNSASWSGGGVWGEYDSELELTNCTVSGNIASKGGGLGCDSDRLFVTNSIIALNYGGDIEIDGELSGELSHNLIDIDDPGFVVAPVFEDGVLVNADELDLRLSSGSLAIDGGDNGAAYSAGLNEYSTDLSGNLRFIGSAIDIGAYEYGSFDPTMVTSLLDTVDSTDGVWTLREAIDYASSSWGETITFDPSLRGGTIALSSELSLDTNITIDGGDLGITVSGGGNHRVFKVNFDAEVALAGLTITGGNEDSDVGGGVLCRNRSTLTMTNCVVSGNSATFGGGVFGAADTTLTLTDCVVSGNSAGHSGGGVYGNQSTLTLANCTVSGNSAGSGGGVVGSGDGSTLTLIDCVVSENVAYYGSGGGAISSGALLTLTNCTVSGNSAGSGGGGVYGEGTLTLTNCTVSGNSSDYKGGGIYGSGYGSTLTLTDCTVSGNIAEMGGGVYCDQYNSLTLTNCEVSDNSAAVGGGIYGDEDVLTLTNCVISGNSAYSYGGMFCYSSGLTLTDCTVSGNSAVDTGGGITSGNGYLRLTGCVISDNVCGDESDGLLIGGYGGGLHIILSETENGANTAILTDCVISGNAVGFTGLGGGLYVESYGGQLTLTDCEVSGNDGFQGGGIFLENDGEVTLTGCVIKNNTAAGDSGMGGGLCLMTSVEMTLTDCQVIGNTAGSDIYDEENGENNAFNAYGGGIYLQGFLTLTDCVVSDNTAAGCEESFGGGVYCEVDSELTLTGSVISGNSVTVSQGWENDWYGLGGGVCGNDYSTVTLTNCTVSGNSAFEGGGVASFGSTLTLTNCTVSGNSAGEGGGLYTDGGTVTLTNSIVALNYGGDIEGELSGESSHNLIDVDPDFVTAPIFSADGKLLNAETLDLRLTGYSAALNAGDNSANTTEFDLDGNPRI